MKRKPRETTAWEVRENGEYRVVRPTRKQALDDVHVLGEGATIHRIVPVKARKR